MKLLNYIIYSLAASIFMLLTSCLDDGVETIALQQGDFDELLLGSWKVESCKLYDPDTEVYHSDLLNADKLDYIYTISETNSMEINPSGIAHSLSWQANENSQILRLESNNYIIESLGKNLMVLTSSARVNNEDYILKYHLHKVEVSEDDYEEDESVTEVVGTNESRRFRRAGYTFIIPYGAVPRGDNGSDGSVAFAVERMSNSELPSAPDGVQFIEGTGISASPAYFTFASPIIIKVPLKDYPLQDVCFYQWDFILNRWIVVPFSSINDDGTANVSVIELGYFVLGKKPTGTNYGGIKVHKAQIESGYYYYLNVIPENNIGVSSISFTSGGEDLYMANLPLGNYTVQIARQRRNSLNDEATNIESSTATQSITIRTTLTPRGNKYSDYEGWTILDINSIDWKDDRPSSWGTETVTYGTGAFQSTLNWINYYNSTTDYDLHLTTPSGAEVFYGNKRAGVFELDRDVISEVGNCTENIYSVDNNLPTGTYKVSVVHFNGASNRDFNCHVIINGRLVKTYSGQTNGTQLIYTFTLQ